MLLINREQVMQLLSMADCIAVNEKAFAELSSGTAVLPLRINIPTPDGMAFYMPAFLKESVALACKAVATYKNNPIKYNLPTVVATVLLQDVNTGQVICVMEGGFLTAMRTGAASGVATKYLARKDKGQVAGIIGAGVQGRTQLWGVSLARNLSKAYVYDVSAEAVGKFIKEMSAKLKLEIIKAGTIDELLSKSDIICTATSSATPIFDGNKVKEGTHINGIGSHAPKVRELDTAIIKRSKIVADSYDAALGEAGDIMIPIQEGAITRAHVYGELGEVITGKKPGRTSDKEITLFKGNGLAIQDAATAKLVYDKALKAKVGTEVAF